MPGLKETKVAMCSKENAKNDQSELKQSCVSDTGDHVEALDKELTNGHSSIESVVNSNGDALSNLGLLRTENQGPFENSIAVSSSPEDILSDVCSMLGTSSYSLSRRSDHLLGDDARMTNLRKQLSLVMTGTYNSVVNTSSTNPHNFKWPSTCSNGIDALKSPTFSMADIAVVVPSNISAQEIPNTHSYYDSVDGEPLDEEGKVSNIESETVQSNKQSTDLFLKNRLESGSSPKNKRNKSHVTKPSSVEKKVKSPSSKESFFTNSQATEKDDFSQSNDTKHGNNELTDKRLQSNETNKSIDSAIALTSSQAKTSNASSASVELAQNKLTKDSPAGFDSAAKIAAAEQQMACNANNGVNSNQLHDLADGVIDEFSLPDYADDSEWQYVGRNKPKRRQNQTQKTPAPSNTRQVRYSAAPNFQRKKAFPERKWAQNRTSQTPKPRTLISRPTVRPALTQQSTHNVKSAYPLRTSTTNVNSLVKTYTAKSATDIEGVSAVSTSDTSLIQNDNVSSPCDTVVQPGLQQSLADKTINHSMQQHQGSNTDGDNMNSAMNNSSETVSKSTYPNASVELSKVDENGNIAGPTSTEQTTEKVNMTAAADSLPAPVSALPKLEGEELIKQLKHQLEYYFSRENLAQDPYLVSQMDSQQYVSIWTIANFNAIKKLTSDVSMVVEALRDSTLVQVDEAGERVRPNQSRCIVILREIPEGVKRSQIEALFVGAQSKFSSCEFEGNGNWFVLFETENDAQVAYRHLRETTREFMGKPIMARIKSKTHHLNTYSCQSLSQSQDVRKVNMEQQLPTVTAAPQVPQQVASTPLEYLHPQQVLFCPQPHFSTTAHPGTHVAAPPFIARVAAPNPATVPTSGHAQVSPVALNPPFNNFMMPWQATGIYSDPSVVMSSQFAATPFLQPTYKPGQVPQHHYPHSSSSHKSMNSSGHRFTDFHRGVNQRNSYSQRKLSGGHHPAQPQQQQQQHGASAQTMPQSRYILSTDPNPPNLVSDMIGQYVQSDQAPTHVAHSIQSHHPTHYLPAVPAPFVTPNANDPNLVAISQQQMSVIPHGNLHSRTAPRRPPSQSLHHPSNRSQAHPIPHQGNNSVASSGNRSRYSHSSRSSAHYQPDVGPRFFQKGMNQQQQPQGSDSGSYSYQTSGTYTQKPPTSSTSDPPLHGSSQEYRLSYNSKPAGSYPMNEQHSSRPRSPQSTVEKGYSSPDGQRPHGTTDEAFSNVSGDPNNNYVKRNNLMRANSNNGQSTTASNTAAATGDQRGLQGGMEQRRNSRPRRSRRNDDDRSSFTTPPLMAPGNPSFNLESNSFPPLPGAPETSTPTNGQSGELRPVAADVVKGLDTTKPSVQETIPSVPPPKKYSEVSSASPVTKNPPQVKPHPVTTDPAKVVKKPESKPKAPSAVNTQPVADKHPPLVNKKPTHHAKASHAEKEHGEVTKPAQAPRASTTPATHTTTTPPTTKKSTRATPAPVARKDSRKSAPPSTVQKSESSNAKVETNADAKAKETADPEHAHGEDDSADASDRKPTYAEMLKIKNAAAAAQMNGKAMSDSGKSDSGDDRKSGNDAPETDARVPAETKSEHVVQQKRHEGNSEAPDKREGAMSGNSRRGDHEPFRRGSFHRYSHRDRNDDYRGNRPRDWNGERGNGSREYRNRGGGNFRGRHGGGYRDPRDRFFRPASGRQMPNGQVASER